MRLFTKTKEVVSVASIMSTFNETISKLTSHASDMDSKAVTHAEEIKIAEANKANAEKEANKARSIADKLTKIVE
jgi:hypothetical protein